MSSSEQAEPQLGPNLWFLKSTHPVFLPAHPALTLPEDEFEAFLQQDLERTHEEDGHSEEAGSAPETGTVVVSDASTTADVRETLNGMSIGVDDPEDKAPAPPHDDDNKNNNNSSNSPFMKGLVSYSRDGQQGPSGGIPDIKNKMFTENGDGAYRSTGEPLVDLFAELEDVVSGPRLLELLESAWRDDPAATLKIIFNARSIHLGKASRHTFYRCAGWLARNHPRTLIANLPWLSRPVIPKKAERRREEGKGTLDDDDDDDDDDMVLVEGEAGGEDDPSRFDVKNGVAHGYWKDLLNMLALRVNDRLDVLANPREVLNVEEKQHKYHWPRTQEAADRARRRKRDARHDAATRHFREDAVYRALHLAVARLFAAQLGADLALLRGEDARARRRISLCGKWAPSLERFHDRHTLVATSIAEILHPLSGFRGLDSTRDGTGGGTGGGGGQQRTLYLRHAREAYRRDLAALRRHLACAERDITAKTHENIQYDRVPSIAMNNYAPLFASRDPERFGAYVDQVARGRARISGATLLPSTLVRMARDAQQMRAGHPPTGGPAGGGRRRRRGTRALVQARVDEMTAQSLDGQWRALVRRVRDAGALENCIAVADVSGSMGLPIFPDGTCPMDSAVGLALLVAEVCRPPFGGAFITFSTNPRVETVDPSLAFQDKCRQLRTADWSMSSDFVAVFERLILPMAVRNQVRPEDMVRRVFVFSDMHFNQACHRAAAPWSSSYERVRGLFRDAGYEMPELVFWNLAGGRAGHLGGGSRGSRGDPTAPKPVVAGEIGTALVSGYSQGMLKVFLDNGMFDDDDDEEEEIVEKMGEDGEVIVDKVKRRKLDPMGLVRKAIGHKAYSMLRVVD